MEQVVLTIVLSAALVSLLAFVIGIIRFFSPASCKRRRKSTTLRAVDHEDGASKKTGT